MTIIIKQNRRSVWISAYSRLKQNQYMLSNKRFRTEWIKGVHRHTANNDQLHNEKKNEEIILHTKIIAAYDQNGYQTCNGCYEEEKNACIYVLQAKIIIFKSISIFSWAMVGFDWRFYASHHPFSTLINQSHQITSWVIHRLCW